MRRLLARAKWRTKRLLKPALQRLALPPSSLVPADWGLAGDASQGLTLQGHSLTGLARKWGSPLYVMDADALRANARRFTNPHGSPSGCEVYYSYKTHPVPAALDVLHGNGIGAEVISHYELWLARRLGVAPERIVYNGPGKSAESIRDAIDMGVQIININHAEETSRVAAAAHAAARKPRVGLRVTTGGGWTGQFGTPLAGGAALAAFAEAETTGVLDVVGIHAHVGGMIRSTQALLHAVTSLLDFVEQLEAQRGRPLEILDFGGSLATPAVAGLGELDLRFNRTFQRDLPEPQPRDCLSIEDYVTTVRQAVEQRYLQRRRPMPRIFLEPGRSLTSNTTLLLASVLGSKRTSDSHFLILDAGINIAESVRSEYHHMLPAQGWQETPSCTYTVVGPICTPGDTLRYAWRCRQLSEGDVVAIMDAGAYFVPFSTSFSYPRPAIVMLDGGRDQLVRRAESFEDLIARDFLPGDGRSRSPALRDAQNL